MTAGIAYIEDQNPLAHVFPRGSASELSSPGRCSTQNLGLVIVSS